MCMDDIRIGRKSGYAMTVIASTATAVKTKLIPESLNRVGLIISYAGTPITIGTKQQAPTALTGIFLGEVGVPSAAVAGALAVPLVMRIEQWGRAITDAWDYFDAVGGNTIHITEIFLEEK